jgi:hypothetical protein
MQYMKRFRLGLMLLVTLSTSAMAEQLPYPCGSKTKFEVKTERGLPLPIVPPDKAMVVVVRDKTILFNLGFAVDGKWVGATRRDEPNYFYLLLGPGEYKSCAYGANGPTSLTPAFLTLAVEANKTYYVEIAFTDDGSWSKGRAKLSFVDAEQGSQMVKRGHFAKMLKP